ncbi:hypothetical protein T310_4599, partial [Rasamsonia emersonii CBS 393.64]
EIRTLRAETERKTRKKARRRAILGNDTLLSVQEGQNRIQQLDTQLNEKLDEPTPMPQRRAPQRCSGLGAAKIRRSVVFVARWLITLRKYTLRIWRSEGPEHLGINI